MLRLRVTESHPVFWVIVGVATIPILIGVTAFISTIGRWKEDDLAAAGSLAMIGGLILAVCFVQRSNKSHLQIDAMRGTVAWIEGNDVRTTKPRETILLAELGPLSIKQADAGYHWVVAAGFPGLFVYCTRDLEAAKQRHGLLQRIIDVHLIRQILSTDAPDDGAFRDDNVAFRVRTAVPDRARLDEVLAVLARDSSLAARVEELRRALARV